MNLGLKTNRAQFRRRLEGGMTLIEVVIAMLITGLAISGVIMGYTYCTTSAEKAALTLAASAKAMERIEETRSAQWRTITSPIDQLNATNFPKKNVILDLSGTGQATTTASIQTYITQISTNPPLRRVRVDCVWQFKSLKLTNTMETCRSPDQ